MSAGGELHSKMQQYQERAQSRASRAVQVVRSVSPAPSAHAYRSGWSRPPQVEAPQAGALKQMSRASSAPGLRSRLTAAGFEPASSVAAAVDRASSSKRSMAPTCDVASEASGVTCSSRASSEPMAGGAESSFQALGPRREGWLSKRTSGKYTARWQRRYFALEGCRLCYMPQPGSLTRRTFDLRKAKHVGPIAGSPREIELDFGFRIWRLRADTVEDARRWLLLLEAARLLAGGGPPIDDGAEDWSDEESGTSTASTADSTSEPGRMAPGQAGRNSRSAGASRAEVPSPPALPPARPIEDVLEVDPEALDVSFDRWFAGLPEGLGSASSSLVREGLQQALRGLWQALGGGEHTATASSPEGAISALRKLRPDRAALGGAADGVLLEYLLRMRRKLERWLETDPTAEEVEDVVTWFLFEALPELERFAAGVSALAAEPPKAWRGAADDLVRMLLSDWEARSCDEVGLRLEALYASSSDASHAAPLRRPMTPRNGTLGPEASAVAARSDAAAAELESAARRCKAWQSHEEAADRAASALIAALNAALRSYRRSTQRLLSPWLPSDSSSSCGLGDIPVRRLRRASSQLAELGCCMAQAPPCVAGAGPSTKEPPSAELVVALVTEALRLAALCGEEAASAIAAGPCGDVLPAFRAAFAREADVSASLLAEMHFGVARRVVLQRISFGRCASEPTGVLADAAAVARGFLDEACVGASLEASRLCGEAVLAVVVRRWVHAFCKAAPKLTACPALRASITADAASLERLATRWGASSSSAPVPTPAPVLALREVGAALAAPELGGEGACAASGRGALDAVLGSAERRELRAALRALAGRRLSLIHI